MSEPITRTETYLAALSGEAVTPPEPITRLDMYLAYLNGMVDTYPEPIARIEQYLFSLCEKGPGGGGADAEALEKLDLYERYFRAVAGESFQDWNPQPIDPNETATFEEAPEKYMITVETRGITYQVRGDCPRCCIFPEMGQEFTVSGNYETHREVVLPMVFSIYDDDDGKDVTTGPVFDASRYKPKNKRDGSLIPVRWNPFIAEYDTRTFIALPEVCNFNYSKFGFIHVEEEIYLSQGLSFGKKVYNMTANTIFYSQTSVGDKPVYVMDGFEGNLYLAKLNISAEHMLGIINNLADMTGTGTTYTLNFGSHNLEKLTEEEIAIAEGKGWTVT